MKPITFLEAICVMLLYVKITHPEFSWLVVFAPIVLQLVEAIINLFLKERAKDLLTTWYVRILMRRKGK